MDKTEKTMLTILLTIAGLALLASMTSCSSAKVYSIGNEWKKMPKQSEITGWSR